MFVQPATVIFNFFNNYCFGGSQTKYIFELNIACTGVKSRAVPARRRVPSDRAAHQGGDGGPRGARHAQTPSRNRRSSAHTPGIFLFNYFQRTT